MAEKKYTVEPFSVEKTMAADGALFNKHVKLMHGLFEIDISGIREQVKTAKKQQKEPVSVLACLFYCYARTLDKYREAFALRGRGNKLYRFEEADAFFPFEITQGNKKMLWHKVVRGINKKTVYELEAALKSLTLIKKEISPAEKFFFKLPQFVRNWFYNYMMRRPLLRKDYGGNVYFSSTIHSGNTRVLSFGVPSHFHTTGMFIGTFKEAPNNAGNPNGSMVGITLSLDHIISDGPMLARLIREFTFQVEHFVL
ncbi:hypothetical protein [Parasediminibacterium sp. JCM 36343]|uniref:hypothetical protein n=1 Tax=Parasediminibacterium sp. JCM 36343 TaxID=3374279 RepID=UPI0039793BDA